ncbi:MAG: YraN family protein [Acidimicrobiales bacterium]
MPPAADRRRALGAAGEDLAAKWYSSRGYEVLARNWRCPRGEVDLIAARKGEIVFCEVKARASASFGTPAEAVTAAKQRRLRLLATLWFVDNPAQQARVVRFDVACVMSGSLEIIEAAF